VEGDYDRELLLVKISEANAKFFRSYKPALSIRTYLNDRNDSTEKAFQLSLTLSGQKNATRNSKPSRRRRPARQRKENSLCLCSRICACPLSKDPGL
jgi:hypothetical protein